MALPPINVIIGADTSALDNGLSKAKKGLKGLAIAGAAAGAAVAAGLAAMTKAGLANVDMQAKLARSMDGTVNGLRALQIAAGDVGVSKEEAATAMQKMNRELVRAKEVGSPAYEALQKLGLASKDFAGLDIDERAALMADRIKQLGLNSGETSDILRDLGVRSRLMALLFLEGGDAIRKATGEVTAFGLALSDSQVAGIEAANDAVSRMSFVFEGLQNRLAAEVAPALLAVSKQFQALSKSDAVQDAIERLATAFGSLAAIVLSEDFIGTAIGGLETLAGVAASAANGMLFLAENTGIVFAALGVFAGGAIALGGPLMVMAGLLTVGLAGLALWKGEADDAAKGSDAATLAQDELNRALAYFSETSAPSAGKAAIKAATDNYNLADSAFAAAEATLALSQSRLDADKNSSGRNANPRDRGRLELAVDIDQRQMDKARAALAEAQARRVSTATAVTGSDFGGGMLPEPDGETDSPIIPGLPGAEKVSSDLAARLEALTEGLMTEQETVAEWYGEGQQTLADALANKLITEEEYRDKLQTLEGEHQDRLTSITKMGEAARISSVIGAGQTVLNAVGQTNDKALKAAKVFGAARALVDAWGAYAKVLNSEEAMPWWARLAAGAKVLAAGIGAVSAINGVSAGGGGATASAGGGGGGGGATQEAAAPVSRNVAISLSGGDMFGRDQVIGLINSINEAVEDGAIVRLV